MKSDILRRGHGQISSILGYIPTSGLWLPLEKESGKWDEAGASNVVSDCLFKKHLTIYGKI